MPIYEYRCNACSHEHEAIRKFSDAPLTTCPACGKESLVKKVSAAGFQLKGSGWYQTDFKGGSKPAAAAEPKSDSANGNATPAGDAKAGEAAPAGKADAATAKPEAKPDTKAAPAGGTAAAS